MIELMPKRVLALCLEKVQQYSYHYCDCVGKTIWIKRVLRKILSRDLIKEISFSKFLYKF
jgi:hypothetical protein